MIVKVKYGSIYLHERCVVDACDTWSVPYDMTVDKKPLAVQLENYLKIARMDRPRKIVDGISRNGHFIIYAAHKRWYEK